MSQYFASIVNKKSLIDRGNSKIKPFAALYILNRIHFKNFAWSWVSIIYNLQGNDKKNLIFKSKHHSSTLHLTLSSINCICYSLILSCSWYYLIYFWIYEEVCDRGCFDWIQKDLKLGDNSICCTRWLRLDYFYSPSLLSAITR